MITCTEKVSEFDIWVPDYTSLQTPIYRGTQRRFPPKYVENTFQGIQSTFKRSLQMHSKRRYEIFICSVILNSGTYYKSFLQRLQYYFSENFRYNLAFYENEKFISMKNITSDNRMEFTMQTSKVVHDWKFHLEIFSRVPKQKKILGNICSSKQIFYRNQSLGAPEYRCIIYL